MKSLPSTVTIGLGEDVATAPTSPHVPGDTSRCHFASIVVVLKGEALAAVKEISAAVNVAAVTAAGSVTTKSRVIAAKLVPVMVWSVLVLSPGVNPPPPPSGGAKSLEIVTVNGG
jgi:hypothetical protein